MPRSIKHVGKRPILGASLILVDVSLEALQGLQCVDCRCESMIVHSVRLSGFCDICYHPRVGEGSIGYASLPTDSWPEALSMSVGIVTYAFKFCTCLLNNLKNFPIGASTRLPKITQRQFICIMSYSTNTTVDCRRNL